MRRWTKTAFLVFVVMSAACAPDDGEEVESEGEALSAVDNGAGAGAERFKSDPCANPNAFARDHGFHLIVARAGEHNIDGTAGRDLIVGTDGDDHIDGKGGADVICAGGGEDVVRGGAGEDWIDGGSDNDKLFGDEGDDVIHGRGGSDHIYGGAGDDELYGDILDDHLFGEDGNDLLIGGHGTDTLNGGPGNDYMRGDTGNDSFLGGKGTDIASFVTAMPPGQPSVVGKPNKFDGVRVDFSDKCTEAGGTHDGCANGDGGHEPLDGVEIVIGSPYTDEFKAGGGNVRFMGGYGDDVCDGTACGEALPPGGGQAIFVTLDEKRARDVGIVVRGTTGGDGIDVVRESAGYRVKPTSNIKLMAGPGCRGEGVSVVCSSKHVVRWIAAWMGEGSDVVKLAEAAGNSLAFPVDMTAHVSGGDGDDWLHGGDEQDVFFTGPTGKDHLYGNKGSDALLSESRKWAPKNCSGMTPGEREKDPFCIEDKPRVDDYTDGADELYGGPDDDQLVTDYPCGGHLNSGGGGKDIAGFARSGYFKLHAQFAGAASKNTDFHGHAFNPQLCGVEHATRFEDDLEILEAADGDDELWGNDEPNTIWGRKGNDVIHGLGGDDTLHGLEGRDTIFGGGGNDTSDATSEDQFFQDAE